MRFVKIFFGVVLCICAFGFIVAAFQVETSMLPLFIVLVGLCVLGAVLLLKKPKRKAPAAEQITETHASTILDGLVTVQTEHAPSDVPDDIARDMRKHYTLMQAQRDVEIMADSYRLASTTTNLEVFCARYNLALQKAYTLLQAEQVGVRGIKKLKFHDACLSVIEADQSLKVRALHDYATEEINGAEALKTVKGKHNRYIKMLSVLEKAEPTFMLMDEYEALLEKVKAHIAQFESPANT